MIKRLTKKFMMESWKKIKRVAGIGALGVASLVSPESAQASQLKIAQAQTEVDKAEFGVAPKNEAVIKMTHRMVDITDDKGNVIGRAEEGSKDWVKLEKQRIAA